MQNSNILMYTTEDGITKVEVTFENDTVWLSIDQMAELFQRDKSTISRHIKNIFAEGELNKNSVVANFATTASDGKVYQVDYYNLDVIISVGYRVKSLRGTQFRIWATQRLREYLVRGYVVHEKRLHQLGQVVQLMRRVENRLDARQVLDVIEHYSTGLNLLDDYDHQCLTRPAGSTQCYVLEYDECRKLIDSMSFGAESDLFGREKDDSFRGALGNIYQSFGGADIYPTMEEKAARLLYFTVKNHAFFDGNKRIAAAVFLYFLDRNNALFLNGNKRLADATLVALVILIAESRPDEMETIISVILNCMQP